METMTCTDKKCGIHGRVRTHGRTFVGTVTQGKAQRTATVSWERLHFVPKYERYEKRRTVVKAHNPACIEARKGEIVRIMESKPISKTKHFVIIERVGKNWQYMAKEELLQEDAKLVTAAAIESKNKEKDTNSNSKENK